MSKNVKDNQFNSRISNTIINSSADCNNNGDSCVYKNKNKKTYKEIFNN